MSPAWTQPSSPQWSSRSRERSTGLRTGTLPRSVAMRSIESPNAAVQRPHAVQSSAARVHNEMTNMRRARDAVSRSAATACYTPANASS
jgi:hypothetical protein